MSIATEGIPAVMNVTPANGNGYNNGGWGGDWASWIILFLIFGMFGWGGMGFGGGFGGFGMGGGMYGTEAILQRQLDTQSIISKLDGITTGLCDGFYAMAGQLSSMGMTIQQGFNQANITALQGQNALQAQLADCCCQTQRAIDGVNYNLATQGCATQTAIANSTRDIVDNANANTRAILDYLCQEKISDLQAENQNLKLAASQSAQNAFIAANQQAQTAELIRRLGADCPTPAYIVQPPQPVAFQLNGAGQATFGNGCGGCNGYSGYNC